MTIFILSLTKHLQHLWHLPQGYFATFSHRLSEPKKKEKKIARKLQTSVLDCDTPDTYLLKGFSKKCCILCREWKSVTLKIISQITSMSNIRSQPNFKKIFER